jgi:hypothetical protein
LEGNEWSILDGLHSSLSFIGNFFSKKRFIKTSKFENDFFLKDFNHQKRGEKK